MRINARAPYTPPLSAPEIPDHGVLVGFLTRRAMRFERNGVARFSAKRRQCICAAELYTWVWKTALYALLMEYVSTAFYAGGRDMPSGRVAWLSTQGT